MGSKYVGRKTDNVTNASALCVGSLAEIVEGMYRGVIILGTYEKLVAVWVPEKCPCDLASTWERSSPSFKVRILEDDERVILSNGFENLKGQQ